MSGSFTLAVCDRAYRYELEKLCRLFFPFAKIQVQVCEGAGEQSGFLGDGAAALRRVEKGRAYLTGRVEMGGQRVQRQTELAADPSSYEEDCERELAVLLYECLSELTGMRPKWGILTGVRPAKLMRRLTGRMGHEAASAYFRDKLLVAPEKIRLCREVGASEDAVTALSRPDSFSLYISIPFCPSRCSYCSFVSNSVEKAGKLIPGYVELLLKEIRQTGRLAAQSGLRLETVYFGGGTPTTLTAGQLTAVMEAVTACFDLSHLREYTVEAGRPDTITADKLRAIQAGGATRISINPQTMEDKVLAAIGRRHTAAETEEAFGLARSLGFDNINMDVIAGLPADRLDGFGRTLDRILALEPESVTIHTLSMKRASRLSTGGLLPERQAGEEAAAMVELGEKRLRAAGILPYYMYRQSKTVGNLENVGYAKKGYEGLYNVYIMDETHTILACGASGVTKLRDPDSNHIERIFNFKYPYEYSSRFEEMAARKDRVKTFYEEYGPASDRSRSD
ncbi:MAG: coproporphyrinogen dehydrogenase HemZ [Clostridiales bacterium]|nr:coproporphyrinogen dehydrogenase HemZ [Clostridiales bacterium]